MLPGVHRQRLEHWARRRVAALYHYQENVKEVRRRDCLVIGAE
jgi:hypothetical protein